MRLRGQPHGHDLHHALRTRIFQAALVLLYVGMLARCTCEVFNKGQRSRVWCPCAEATSVHAPVQGPTEGNSFWRAGLGRRSTATNPATVPGAWKAEGPSGANGSIAVDSKGNAHTEPVAQV